MTSTVHITGSDPQDLREIFVSVPRDQNKKLVTIHMWVEKNLTPEELELWKSCEHEHQLVVESAKENGDAWAEGDQSAFVIRWKSVEVHLEYMNKISRKSHALYKEVWQRYHNDREAIAASSY